MRAPGPPVGGRQQVVHTNMQLVQQQLEFRVPHYWECKSAAEIRPMFK